MNRKSRKRQLKGLVKLDSSKEIYKISEVSANKKELILSVLTPTILQLV